MKFLQPWIEAFLSNSLDITEWCVPVYVSISSQFSVIEFMNATFMILNSYRNAFAWIEH